MSPHSPDDDSRLAEPVAHEPLAVVDRVGRVLARFDGEDHETGYAEALRLVADGFSATWSVVLRFEDDGAHIVGMWADGRYVRDPQVRLSNDLLPADAPLRSQREPLVLAPEAFGEEVGRMLRSRGANQSLLVAPISDAGAVKGAVALLCPEAGDYRRDDVVAVQLCGELLWRHMRHHESQKELHERAEIAEILAHVGGRLHEGGIAESRDLLSEVFQAVAEHVGADVVVAYERTGRSAVSLIQWNAGDETAAPALLEFTDEQWGQFEASPVGWSELVVDPLVEGLVDSFRAGLVLPGMENGRLVGLFVVASRDNRPYSEAHVELITSAVRLLGQFRVRMGEELALVRRGVVEQCRSEIAEAFINSPSSAIDETVSVAMRRIGSVFGARRVRWVEMDAQGSSATLAIEWSDGSRPAAPVDFAVDQPRSLDLNQLREPFVLNPRQVADHCGVDTPSPTLVVPCVVGDRIKAMLTLTGDGASAELPPDERRVLTDLAGLVLQARQRAQQELEAEYRKTLDDLQLRLARRFLDRKVVEDGPVLDWVLEELGETLGCDLIAFAEYVGTEDGEMHWWSRGSAPAEVATTLIAQSDAFAMHFAKCLESGEPLATRSRMLPDEMRETAEAVSKSEFSMVVVPFRAPGVALLLGVCSLRDREWRAVETALLQRVIAQMRQFLDVVAGRARLEFEASHDALTGLANRRRLAQEFERLVEGDGRAAVLMIDVDRFKVVNDSLGHSAGDAVLVAIADRIRMSIRDGDIVGRFGGDEFAVMIDDAVSDLELAATADRLIGVIREPIVVGGTTVIPTCSIGIAVASRGDDVEAVLRHADAALYDAKAKGRDRYEFFDDTHRQILTERLHLETALRQSVADEQFVPWFQPEYDLITGQIVGVEALVRWNHPTEGVLDASRFIDTAEEIGLAMELSRMVLRSSFETLRGWMDEGFETRMRVNIAAAQLQSRELAGQIVEALATHTIPPDRLCVEITERSLMLDPASAIETLGEVRALGVEVAVDDFGTGFSSLARLKDLPVDTLKIDRSFVSGIVSSATDREIVRTIIWLSRGLGLDVVAEGVEQSEQVELLLELGCRRAQGWLWSPAVRAAEVPRLARV